MLNKLTNKQGERMLKEKILVTKGINVNWKKAISHLPKDNEKFIKLSVSKEFINYWNKERA